MNRLDEITKDQLKEDAPSFGTGDTVKVHVKIVEGGKERIQVFQGTVIRQQGGGISKTFTVRKISHKVGTERIFPLHSPSITKVEVVSHGQVRRSKLYYLRERTGKAAKVKTRIVKKRIG
ncbi:50S ribosomal protein L19 [bacterium]|nr:50S ribosomal protein L19 [bacterium]